MKGMTIKDLIKLEKPPMTWRIPKTESPFCFEFRHPHTNEWTKVITARGEIKEFITLDGLFRDIMKVQPSVAIYFGNKTGIL